MQPVVTAHLKLVRWELAVRKLMLELADDAMDVLLPTRCRERLVVVVCAEDDDARLLCVGWAPTALSISSIVTRHVDSDDRCCRRRFGLPVVQK